MEEDIEWGSDDDYLFANTQPALTNPVVRQREEPEETICTEIKEEDDEWGPDEDNEFLVSASQTVEEKLKSPATAGSNGDLPVGASPPPAIESRALSFLKSREQESTNSGWNAEVDVGEGSATGSEYEKILAENMAIKEKLYAVLGENSTLRRKMESTNEAKNQEMYQRVQKEMEEKKKEAEVKREAADEKEKLNSELASQKMEVLKLQWKVRHSKNRDSSILGELSPQQSQASTSMRFPTRKSAMAKTFPPVPKFPTSSHGVKQRLLQMAGVASGPAENEKQLIKEPETRDFSLRKPATLSDYENDEYKWEANGDNDEDDCFLNLSNISANQERMEEDLSEDSDSSSSSDDSFIDWEVELAQNPTPPIPPELPTLSLEDEVINWIKQDSRQSSTSKINVKDKEEEKRSSILEKLVDLATSRAPWVQTFRYIQKNVDHRFEAVRTVVADVARVAPHVIGDVESTLSSDVEIQAEEGRLWKWYLKHIDKKHQEGDRQRLRAPSHMPSNCDAPPSMEFLNFVTYLPTEPLSAWSLISHIRVQLQDFIWISDIRNEWRIYGRNNLEAFLKLIMWVSELWPYVLEEENIPELVQSHLPHWQTELKAWTTVLLEIGNGDYLFHGKFRRMILTLVLEIFAKIMKAGYFHATSENYKLLSSILKLACNHPTWLTCKILMDVCTVLKYGFKDKLFINLLCGGVNESLCLMDNISIGFLESFSKETVPALKAKLFYEYVSTLNILMHKDPPVYYSSKLSRANLIDKKTDYTINEYPNEDDEDITDSHDDVWLHPNNWEDPDKCRGFCQCRKILCGNVIIMFSDILPLWRDAVYEAESQLATLQKQQKMEDDEFLKQYEIDKKLSHKDEELTARETEKLNKNLKGAFAKFKLSNKYFKDAQLTFSFPPCDLPKIEEYMRNLEVYESKLAEYKEKKATLISRRRDYEKDIMTQGVLDDEVFSNWTQVGKLLRKRLGIHLPWWLKRYEREPTIFDQALETGMVFMHHFLNCSNLASAIGDEGLRDFLIVTPILKAYCDDFLTNNRMAPIIRELTTICGPQYPMPTQKDSPDGGLSSSVQSEQLKSSHRLVYTRGERILKVVPHTDEYLPDLKQSDLNRQQKLLDSEKQELSSQSFTFRSFANQAEKNRVMETDDVVWMRKRLKTKNIDDIIRPTGCQSNALRLKQFTHPLRKSSNADEGSRYLNENGEDTTPQRHKRDKNHTTFMKDDGKPYANFGIGNISYVSETERKYFLEKEDGQSGSDSESIVLINDTEDAEIDKRNLKSLFSK